MPSVPPTSNPFYSGGCLTNSKYFVGRQEELRIITAKMTGDQPTSINVYGNKRIGKSSLLYQFFLTSNQRITHHPTNAYKKYVVIYLSLQDANCHNKAGFYQALVTELRKNTLVKQNPQIQQLLTDNLNANTFSDVMKTWKEKFFLPVFCLDDFKCLLKNTQEFNDSFYDSLRALMDAGCLMLIIASDEKIDVYSKQHRLTSNFFNVGYDLHLTVLTEMSALDLVRLPKDAPALTERRQNLALAWGERHPYKLQVAGSFLWEAKQQDKNDQWAKSQFDEQIKKVPQTWLEWRKIWRGFLWPIWVWPRSLLFGSFMTLRVISIGINEVIGLVVALCLIIMLVLAIIDLITWNDFLQGVKKVFCNNLSSVISTKWCSK